MTKKVAKIDLHSNNGQGPRPIHWASRYGKDNSIQETSTICKLYPGTVTWLLWTLFSQPESQWMQPTTKASPL